MQRAIRPIDIWMVSLVLLRVSSSLWSWVSSSGRNLWIRVVNMPRLPRFSSCFIICLSACMESTVSGLVISSAENSS